jgi:hypothetical protein
MYGYLYTHLATAADKWFLLFFLHSVVVCSFTSPSWVCNPSRTQAVPYSLLKRMVVETYWVQSRQIIPPFLMRLDGHPLHDLRCFQRHLFFCFLRATRFLVTHEYSDDIPSADTHFLYLLFIYYLSLAREAAYFLPHPCFRTISNRPFCKKI